MLVMVVQKSQIVNKEVAKLRKAAAKSAPKSAAKKAAVKK